MTYVLAAGWLQRAGLLRNKAVEVRPPEPGGVETGME